MSEAHGHDTHAEKGSTHGLAGDFSAQNIVQGPAVGLTKDLLIPIIDLGINAIVKTGDDLAPLPAGGASSGGGHGGH